MPANGDILQQPPILTRLSQISHLPRDVDKLIRDLENGVSLLEIAVENGAPLSPSDRNHLEVDWLGGGWFGGKAAEVEEKLRLGVLEAARYRRDFGIPAHYFWLTGMSDVRVVVLASKEQATVVICTPDPPSNAHGIGDDPNIRIIESLSAGGVHARRGRGGEN